MTTTTGKKIEDHDFKRGNDRTEPHWACAVCGQVRSAHARGESDELDKCEALANSLECLARNVRGGGISVTYVWEELDKLRVKIPS